MNVMIDTNIAPVCSSVIVRHAVIIKFVRTNILPVKPFDA